MKKIIAWFTRNKKRDALGAEIQRLKNELAALLTLGPEWDWYVLNRGMRGDKIIERMDCIENEIKEL